MQLESIWFFIWGLLWAIFFITDGFDFGVGILYPFIGKNNNEKNIIINSIGPVWDGNEVWLITAGGVTFAAFPSLYAVMFSTLYTPLMIILFALILRGVSFEFRGQLENLKWKKVWDICIFTGSIIPAILFGIFFTNIFQGIPFNKEMIFKGTLFTLLNPYGLLGGLLFLLLFLEHGALWLCIKTTGDLKKRSIKTASIIWPILVLTLISFLITSWFFTNLYSNYLTNPLLFIVILISFITILCMRFLINYKMFFKAWLCSAITIFCVIFFGIIGLYPNLFISSIDKSYTLTAFNSSSSPLTLKIMLIVVIIFIPIIIGYQIWVYYLFLNNKEAKIGETYSKIL